MIQKLFKKLHARFAKPEKFSSVAQYWKWYYRMRPKWLEGIQQDIRNVAESRRIGHAIRMKRIRERKIQREALEREKNRIELNTLMT